MPQQTTVEVRAIAAGGKFLGNDIGGAEITVHDAMTGERVASGRVRGGSGVTSEIMNQPRDWGVPVPVDQSSVLSFTMDLVQPRLLDISAYGPLGSLQSARRATVQQWVAPGMELTGEQGVQVVIAGQLVEIVEPPTHTQLAAPGPVALRANVAMMCGCPLTSPDGGQPAVWPQGGFTVTALVYVLADENPPRLQQVVPLAYAGAPSRFQAEWTMPEAGFYEIVVVARQNGTLNTGVDRTTVFSLPPSPATA
jgi:hypothetical protein